MEYELDIFTIFILKSQYVLIFNIKNIDITFSTLMHF